MTRQGQVGVAGCFHAHHEARKDRCHTQGPAQQFGSFEGSSSCRTVAVFQIHPCKSKNPEHGLRGAQALAMRSDQYTWYTETTE